MIKDIIKTKVALEVLDVEKRIKDLENRPENVYIKKGGESGGGTPGGNDTEGQYNDGGAFAGNPDFTYDKTTHLIELGYAGDTTLGDSTLRVMRPNTASKIDLGTATYPFNQLYGNIINSSGARVGYNLSVYASGTVYTLTNSQALLDFGTTDPSLTIDTAGTYLIMANAHFIYNAATYAANQTLTVKLRRTNNTVADLTNATRTLELRILTTLTDDAGTAVIPPTIYTTANTNDIIQLFGAVSATPAAGSVQCDSAEIIVIRLY